ncbi:ABC transporter ATP-binding protein [Paraburkholderia fungorum]|uniref:ABC transporter ATP-binding protein n=1 Tax=Paraburkholderia fungorum TaxID=134537 RepID=UPI0038B7DC66
MSIIRISNLGKSFRAYRSEFRRIRSWFDRRVQPESEHWVLRNIDFNIGRGVSVGIVGRNGAGKSTLLKLITGTLVPNEGHIEISGTVGSILELGMGFNPELTGRQNARHSLSLMGRNATEIDSVIADIEAFAEIGDYFDQPVRVYSSGMQMRVGFAAVTAFRPDILIVDEALSVGDAYFQHKSFNRISEFRELGTSLLIVSHDRAAIMSLCDRALVLHGGTIVKDAAPAEAMDYYNAIIGHQGMETVRVEYRENGEAQIVSGTGEAAVVALELRDNQGRAVEIMEVGAAVCLYVRVVVKQPIEHLVLGYLLRDRLGQSIYGTNTHHQQRVLRDVEVGENIEFQFHFEARLGPGSYSISTALTSRQDHHEKNYEWRDLALVFEVVNRQHQLFAGCNWMEPELTIQRGLDAWQADNLQET